MNVKIEFSWKEKLKYEFRKPYFIQLIKFLIRERELGNEIYPAGKLIFAAFNYTPFDKIKVVILGQDPYHGEGQANGLCFSVTEGIKIPPSLQNIFKELNNDLGISIPSNGNLESWAKQGVLLLNATLTVRANEAGSHQQKGWEEFTDAAIKALSDTREHLVFMLWGNYAKKKGVYIDRTKHLVLEAAHPSPFSAYHGFFGCNHFKNANEYLIANNKKPIIWIYGSYIA